MTGLRGRNQTKTTASIYFLYISIMRYNQSQQLNTHTESDPLLDVKTTIRQQDDEVEVVVKDKDDDDVECGFSCCCCCCCQAVCYQVSSTYHKLQHVLSVYWSFGLIAFGGTSVHIAIFRDQLVRVKAWMDDEVFMELFALGTYLMCVLVHTKSFFFLILGKKSEMEEIRCLVRFLFVLFWYSQCFFLVFPSSLSFSVFCCDSIAFWCIG